MQPPSRSASSAVEHVVPRALFPLDQRLDAAGPLCLALSGGGDSTALLHIAADWAERRGRDLIALTVDHGLHPDSARWTAQAGEAARSLGLAWRALAWTGPKPSTGLPAAARAARHALLAEAARDVGAKVVLMGHTSDDAIENQWLRVETPGIGQLTDWGPSPAWPEGRGVFLCRPLLVLERADLRDWLTRRGVAWLDDPGNDDMRFARSRARRRQGPVRGDGGAEIRAFFHRTPPPPYGSPDHPVRPERDDGLIALGRNPDARTLSAALLCAAGTSTPPRGEPLKILLARLQAGEDFTATLAGARLVAEEDTVLVGRDPGRKGLPSIAATPGETIVWDGRFELVAEGIGVVPLAGRQARLSRPERTEIAALPAWARPTMPAHLHADGRVALARGVRLGPVRLRAALDQIARESDI